MKSILWLIGGLLSVLSLPAQHQEVHDSPDLWKNRQLQLADTNSLLSAFRRGQVHGHIRYFFMQTENAPGLRDYYAHAWGGGIKFETARFHGFQAGVSGFFVFNLASADLSKPDSASGAPNRYEIGLFDITDTDNRNDIDRLEELYLKYSRKNLQVTFGRQLLNTPFINLQDGRMRPTETGGLWTDVRWTPRTRLQAGYLYEISPRSTVKWYSIAGSIGIYPSGVQENGSKSDYAGNLDSRGILLAGLTHAFDNGIRLQVWDQFVENIFNTSMLQVDWTGDSRAGKQWLAGLQYIRQDAVQEGGHEDASKTYIQPGSVSHTFSLRSGIRTPRWETTMNMTRITAHGRYLMPREWGRDPFYTFLPRERNEGLGDLYAWVLKTSYRPVKGLKAQLAAGYYELPDVENTALNKYGLPSYVQINSDLTYTFSGFLQGMQAQLLYVWKGNASGESVSDKYRQNKVDMHQWNVVLNYHF